MPRKTGTPRKNVQTKRRGGTANKATFREGGIFGKCTTPFADKVYSMAFVNILRDFDQRLGKFLDDNPNCVKDNLQMSQPVNTMRDVLQKVRMDWGSKRFSSISYQPAADVSAGGFASTERNAGTGLVPVWIPTTKGKTDYKPAWIQKDTHRVFY